MTDLSTVSTRALCDELVKREEITDIEINPHAVFVITTSNSNIAKSGIGASRILVVT